MIFRSWFDSDHIGVGFYCARVRFSVEIIGTDFDIIEIWDENDIYKFEELHPDDQKQIMDQIVRRIKGVSA